MVGNWAAFSDIWGVFRLSYRRWRSVRLRVRARAELTRLVSILRLKERPDGRERAIARVTAGRRFRKREPALENPEARGQGGEQVAEAGAGVRPEGDLNTWKEIAAYLGVSPRTAQLWEKSLGLPGKRYPGVRGRVVASAAELKEWKQRVLETGGTPEVERTAELEGRDRRVWRWSLSLAAVGLAAVLAAAGEWMMLGKTDAVGGGESPAVVRLAAHWAAVEAGPGTGSLEIRAAGRWRAESSDQGWLTVNPAEGLGDATIEYSWSANTGRAGRMAAIRVNGRRFTVVQVSEGGESTPWGQVGNGNIVTIAGTGVWGYNGDGLPAVEAQLKNPVGIEVDDNGNVYVADLRNNRIRRIGAKDGVITTVAGVGVNGFNGDSRPAVEIGRAHV